MKIWKTYTGRVNHNCADPRNMKDLDYWRDNLFAGTIICLLPFCLIALVPGVYFSYITRQYILGLVDILTAASIMLVALMPGMSPSLRKIIFVSLLTLLSCALLCYLGLSGPGLLYLLATCIFSILIFPTSYTYWPAWVITLICLLFAGATFLYLIPLPKHNGDGIGEWIAVSSNLVFLSFLFTALIPRLFKGLQETLDKEKQLKEALRNQQDSLQQALDLVRQKNDELEQFAYVASHDLQEPLRMVSSFMGLLKKKYGDQLDEKAHSYINFAVDGGKRMQKMISDLLELSRTGRKDAIKETVNLVEIMIVVQQNIFKLMEENNARIIITPSLPQLSVYPADMSRLLQNLLSNAIKFRKKDIDPVIRLSVTSLGNMWKISIEDNGIGIEEDNYKKIFEIFSRLHAQDAYQGSGIGLAVCKKVAEQHGGDIWVRSEEGKGSTFYFTIEK